MPAPARAACRRPSQGAGLRGPECRLPAPHLGRPAAWPALQLGWEVSGIPPKVALTHQVPRDARADPERSLPSRGGAAPRRAGRARLTGGTFATAPRRRGGGRRSGRAPAGELRGHRAGAGCGPLHLPSVPAGGPACGGARLLMTRMSTVQLGNARAPPRPPGRAAGSAPAPSPPRVRHWGRVRGRMGMRALGRGRRCESPPPGELLRSQYYSYLEAENAPPPPVTSLYLSGFSFNFTPGLPFSRPPFVAFTDLPASDWSGAPRGAALIGQTS